ncbi:MAG: phosphoethanolamine transferase [Gammaproteobacteria bacterium]
MPRRTFELKASVELIVVAAALLWTVTVNRDFLSAATASDGAPAGAAFAAALAVLVFSAHALLLGLVANRWTVKPLVAALTVAGALASYFTTAYGIVLEPSMLRNVIRTDPAEAGELISGRLLAHLALYAGLPLLLLWRVRIARHGWRRSTLQRAGLLGLVALLLAGAVLAQFQPLASRMRNDRSLRYLITPANVVWSLGSVAAADVRGAARPREPIGLDAAAGPSWQARRKPLVVLVVVGETARAANWGLSGYARQTTPELARLPVVNFPEVVSCGTNTEVSVPCMFAPVGRRDYDEARIRGQQSLLHVAARAGVAVHWRDNQSGCKGTCDGLPFERVSSLQDGPPCEGERCQDEGLVRDLGTRLAAAKGTQLWVLHMLGNHGPSYFRRYPERFAKFLPDCRSDELRDCSTEQIVNAYDNALLYTDHLLAATIAQLKARSDEIDSALIYVSDHGESLGEHGLFLHGAPYAIAPDVQTRVPMVAWTSPGLERAAGLAPGCLEPALRRAAGGRISHDHLFHTVLGLLDVRTALHEPALDLVDACRGRAASALVADSGRP